jgi:hypothetical protein
LELFYPCEDSIDLEGKSPSLWLFVVFLKHVNLFSTQILPFTHGFFDPLGLRNPLSQELKEGRFSTTDVSLNGKTEIIGSGLRIDEDFRKNLILISR